MKKKVVVSSVVILLGGGSLFFLRGPHSLEERGFRISFVGFTNETLGPHALLLLQEPENAAAAWLLREVSYNENDVWKTWIPSSLNSPHPYEYKLYESGSNLFASVSIPRTNASSRIVFELQEPRNSISEQVRKLKLRLMEKDSPMRAVRLRMTKTRASFLTNEINLAIKK